VGVNQQRISQITNNTNFSKIGNLLSQGHDMDYIARHYHMDLALVWALRFIESFFILAHKNTGETTRIAFLNADWRDFESTPASKEKPDKSITIFDYHRVLSKTGWKVTPKY